MGIFSNIKTAVTTAFAGVQEGEAPGWIKRLKKASYSSPSGRKFNFLYLDLSLFVPVKSSSFDSVDGDGAYIQHNGLGGARYPVLMIFSDADNDSLAQEALAGLVEIGDGMLSHPVIGEITVVPTGEIEQINAFVTAANQTSIAVEFLENSGLVFDSATGYGTALDSYLSSAADSFADTISVLDKADEVSLGQKALQRVGQVKKALNAVSAGIEKTQSEMDDIYDSISSSIDTLVKSPLMLARQMQHLVMTPSRELSLIKDKLDAYKNLAKSIFADNPEPKPNSYDSESQNGFAIDSLIVGTTTAALTKSSYLAATSTNSTATATVQNLAATEEGALKYRKDFIAAQDAISETSEDFLEWADNGADILSISNNSGEWGELENIVAISTAAVTAQISVSKSEVRFTTTYERPAMAWCFELYRSVKPDVLIYFQQTNNLGGDEIFLIPVGRELVYYV